MIYQVSRQTISTSILLSRNINYDKLLQFLQIVVSPRIKMPSFDEAMREILAFNPGDGKATTRRHQMKSWKNTLWLWLPSGNLT